ncbi:TPA: hypothetical protein HA251_02170 [Candidatus Woesearchaeota archaeon]|nr:hypothetical protein [Candidatus Woesearchaeota archaeon]
MNYRSFVQRHPRLSAAAFIGGSVGIYAIGLELYSSGARDTARQTANIAMDSLESGMPRETAANKAVEYTTSDWSRTSNGDGRYKQGFGIALMVLPLLAAASPSSRKQRPEVTKGYSDMYLRSRP